MTAELLELTEEEYRTLDAINWSTLRWMDESPMSYLDHKNKPLDDTPDFEFGRIAHAFILQDEIFVIGPDDLPNRGTKRFLKEQKNWKNKLITQTEGKMLSRWLSGYRNNEYHDLFQKEPKIEKAIVWMDPDTGIKCKCKPDLFTNDLLLDLKTTKYNTEHAYWNAFAQYLTHCQFAFYKDALYELDGGERKCVVGRLEKPIPYDTIWNALRTDVVWGGRRRYKKLLRDLAKCMETDTWPGKSKDTIQQDQFPQWQLERDLSL